MTEVELVLNKNILLEDVTYLINILIIRINKKMENEENYKKERHNKRTD